MTAIVFGQQRLCPMCGGTGYMRMVSGNGGPVERRVLTQTAVRVMQGAREKGVHPCARCTGGGLIPNGR